MDDVDGFPVPATEQQNQAESQFSMDGSTVRLGRVYEDGLKYGNLIHYYDVRGTATDDVEAVAYRRKQFQWFSFIHLGLQLLIQLDLAIWVEMYGVPWLATLLPGSLNNMFTFDYGDAWWRFLLGVFLPITVLFFVGAFVLSSYSYYASWAAPTKLMGKIKMGGYYDGLAMMGRMILEVSWSCMGFFWAIEMNTVILQWFAAETANDVSTDGTTEPVSVFGMTNDPGARIGASFIATILMLIWYGLMWGIVFRGLVMYRSTDDEEKKTIDKRLRAEFLHLCQHNFVVFNGFFWGLWFARNAVFWALTSWNIPNIVQLLVTHNDLWETCEAMFMLWIMSLVVRFLAALLFNWWYAVKKGTADAGKRKRDIDYGEGVELGDDPKDLKKNTALTPVPAVMSVYLTQWWSLPYIYATIMAFWVAFGVSPGLTSSWTTVSLNGTQNGVCVTNDVTFPNYHVARYPWNYTWQAFIPTIVYFFLFIFIQGFTNYCRQDIVPNVSTVYAIDAPNIIPNDQRRNKFTEAVKRMRKAFRASHAIHHYVTLIFALSNALTAAYWLVTDFPSLVAQSNNIPFNLACAYPTAVPSSIGGVIVTIAMVTVLFAITMFWIGEWKRFESIWPQSM